MKKLLLSFMLSSACLGITAGGKNQSFFISTEINMGYIGIIQESATASFKFINRTTKTVVINRVLPSCGCMIVDYPQKPIRPGDSGQITINLQLGNRDGHFEKSAMVYATGLKPTTLKIKGEK